MAKDRARDDRRSVGSHEKMMGALAKAAGWNNQASDGIERISEKINEETGEIRGAEPGRGHVYHPETNIPLKETRFGKIKPGMKTSWESSGDW